MVCLIRDYYTNAMSTNWGRVNPPPLFIVLLVQFSIISSFGGSVCVCVGCCLSVPFWMIIITTGGPDDVTEEAAVELQRGWLMEHGEKRICSTTR